MAGSTEFKNYNARVLDIIQPPDGGLSGKATIEIDGMAATAYIPTSAKNVRAGDMVIVHKNGVWIINTILTPHPVPEVSVSMGSKPPAAATTSGSVSDVSMTLTAAPLPYKAPSSGVGTTLAQLQVWATSTRAYLQNLESWTWDVRDFLNQKNSQMSSLVTVVNNHATRLTSTQQTVNTNATRVNQTVDYAAGASDAMGGVVQALKDERIVK